MRDFAHHFGEKIFETDAPSPGRIQFNFIDLSCFFKIEAISVSRSSAGIPNFRIDIFAFIGIVSTNVVPPYYFLSVLLTLPVPY